MKARTKKLKNPAADNQVGDNQVIDLLQKINTAKTSDGQVQRDISQDDQYLNKTALTSLNADTRLLDPLINTLFEGKYLIEKRLGQGGMGVVYQAEHILMERTVAIKFLLGDQMIDQKALKYFKREARAAGRIQHPNATAILDFGIANGICYLVMECLTGQTLRSRLKEVSTFSCTETVQIINQVCEAVEAAHTCNVIHCDLKPENIFLHYKDGQIQVKVIDFGIAKILKDQATLDGTGSINTSTSTDIVGTPQYMSPEQCLSAPLTRQSDIYTLGIIAFEMLTGSLPFDSKYPLTTIYKQVHEMPVKPSELNADIPLAMDKVILTALSKAAADRQPSARIFAEQLIKSLYQDAQAEIITAIDPSPNCANPKCKQPELGEPGYCLNCHTMLIGTKVRHRYEIKSLLGKGGFGTTYLVIDHDCFNELRILKELNFNRLKNNYSLNDCELARRLFKREAEVMLNIRHPGIPKMYAYFTEGEQAYLVQQFIPGETLSAELKRKNRVFSEQEAISILSEMTDILKYLHTHNPPIIHRDIKPQNIMRHKHGNLMLIDFGAVNNVAANIESPQQTFVGTPGFAPPEQMYGYPRPQTDIYALGATIINLLSGYNPTRFYNSRNNRLSWRSHIKVSPLFAELLKDMLNPIIDQRLASITALKSRLKQLTKTQHNKERTPLSIMPLITPSNRDQENPNIDINSIANFCYEVENKLYSMENDTYYQFFNIERTATQTEIQAAYEAILKKYHPSVHESWTDYSEQLHQQLSQIISYAAQIYTVLINTDNRNYYNQSLRNSGKLDLRMVSS